MPSTPPNTKRVRSFAAVALGLALFVAYAVVFGYGDGGWPLWIPAFAAGAVLLWPTRSVLITAIIVTAALMILGAMGVGMFFGASLAGLILALGEFKRAPNKATA